MWVHNLDPFLIQLTDTFGIRWYGLAYLTGFVLGGAFVVWMAKRGRRMVPAEQAVDLVTYIVFGTMIGGRLGYAVFYSPDLLTSFGGSFPFWGVLRVWEGGMASHGGIIGVFLAAILFARTRGHDWRTVGDLTIVGGAIGIFLGRVANFINGELFGRAASPDLPWAVRFPQEMYHELKVATGRSLQAATDAQESLRRFADAMTTVGVSPEKWRQWVDTVRTQAQSRFDIQDAIQRAIQAIQSGQDSVTQAFAPVLTPRHPSQLYEGLLEGLLLLVITIVIWHRPRKPGVVGAWFLTLYAVARIFCEQFRLPDAEIGFQLLGLTRGQWLSIGMIVGTLLILVHVTRRPAEAVGGWGRGSKN
jgi:phosphatidylglycerol:prolipoprotein diacylglycerol transferase